MMMIGSLITQHFRYIQNKHPDVEFFTSAYRNIDLNSNHEQIISTSNNTVSGIQKDPFRLLYGNVIGNPSCILIKNIDPPLYDVRLKWIVDIEYYIRYLLKGKQIVYIQDVLINVGVSGEQVTASSFLHPEVEIPENFLFLEIYGSSILKKLMVFDHYWRLIRNLKITNEDTLRKYYPDIKIEPEISRMIKFQAKKNPSLLKNGFYSKLLMILVYWRVIG